ncbi:hypothetical protein [Flavobacterium notoginsengisoli]|uniref:hypothetical protein n=1 Tax=Flavobacterium notoginsengisoli TaxID=1478199 RepID=UPI003631DBB0
MTETQQIKEIDKLVSAQYSSSNYGELKALSKLFDTAFLKELENILNKNSRMEKHYKDRYEVSVGWIDKIPLAKFVHAVNDVNGNPIKTKMELGDLLLIYTHNRINITSKGTEVQSAENRAAIVQAKIAGDKNPKVPIAKISDSRVSSTSKELALLSSWPEFDLYQTSKSKTPLLNNIQLDSTKPNAKFAGYNSKKWYIGRPVYEEECKESMGSLIIGMLKGREGEDFDISKSSDWDRLIETLVVTCGKYKLPNFLFPGSTGDRYLTIPKKPLIFFFSFFKPKKFPIVVINRIVQEG